MSGSIDADVFAAECAPVAPADFVAALLAAGFSPAAYRNAYGDLHGMSATDALGHYLRHGMHERRRALLALNRGGLIGLARLPIADVDFRTHLLTSLLDHLLDESAAPYDAAIADVWPFVRDLRREGACPYLVIGDSHSHHYAIPGCRDGRWLLALHMNCHGGSARGLGNPQSRSGYGEQVRRVVQTVSRLPDTDELPILLQFGQVDVEFVHHFHRVRDGRQALDLEHYRAFCRTTIERYTSFLTELFRPPRRRTVWLVSLFPPALSDEAWRGGHLNDDIVRRETDLSREHLSAGIRTLEIADLRQRTAIHAYYNGLLHAACRQHGFRFLDGFTPFLGACGIVGQSYLVPEVHGFDHHLDARRTGQTVATMVWDLLGRGL